MARSASVNTDQVHELLLQALETERGGIQIYTAALKAAVNDDLKKEWSEYLEETRTHEQVLTRVFEQLELDTEAASPGREVVAHLGASLVKAIEMAIKHDTPEAAQLVAQEDDAEDRRQPGVLTRRRQTRRHHLAGLPPRRTTR